MTAADSNKVLHKGGAFAPLREPVFRRIWSASVISNFGQMILGVGVAWEMTRLTPSASMVALVQTAMMLPLMLVAMPAGAIADMFDRRKIAMSGLGFSIVASALLAILASLNLTTPWLLLMFCSLVGAGVALYSPAWQASIGEQVAPENLPAAVALGTISYNVARSFGPALGGLIVLAAGAKAAFALNAICYLPLFLAFFFWTRKHTPSRLPPERMDRAIVSGARYAFHAWPIRKVLIRSFLFGLAGATTTALAPLIAKNLLHGNASTYGILLGSTGIGAVGGALIVSWVRERMGTESASRLLAVIGGLALILIGFSRNIPLTCLGLILVGGANILTIALFNISVQLAAPRWVIARALSLFSSSLTGGIATGSVVWGTVASHWSVDVAIIASGIVMLMMPLVGMLLPLAQASQEDVEPVEITNQPDVALALTMRSGPIVVELNYCVAPENARGFYGAMLNVQRMRLRNGGFSWSIARDISDPSRWIERYHYPTWGDYLRVRDRFTQTDMDTQATADAFLIAGTEKTVTRRLERPFGSVRWRADSPDSHQQTIGFMGPSGAV